MLWPTRNISLRIAIFSEGPLAVLGHDRIFDQPAQVTVEVAPAGLNGARISAKGDLRKAELTGTASARDRATILEKKDSDVFHTDVFPMFGFEGTYQEAEHLVVGTLTLHGATHACSLPVRLQRPEKEGGLYFVEGGIDLDLQPFGIKPYKALFGAIKVKPFVHVSYSLELQSA